MGHATLNTPFLWLGIAIANQYTKSKVSLCTYYKDMKSGAKCRTQWVV